MRNIFTKVSGNGRVVRMASAVEILKKENAELRAGLKQALAENSLLRQKVQILLKRMFGSKSEKMDPRTRTVACRSE